MSAAVPVGIPLPLVSIAIINYNYEDYVGAAIESALAQDYPNVEVIVVDDGSRDGSRAVIEGYGDRVRAFFQENAGQSAASNRGFALSRGEIFFFLDADDRLLPGAAREVAARMTPGVSKIQFSLGVIDRQGRHLKGRVPRCHPRPETIRETLSEFLSYSCPSNSGQAYSRAFLERRLPIPPRWIGVYPDTYLSFSAPLCGEVKVIDEVLGEYRRHGKGATQYDAAGASPFIELEFSRATLARDYVAATLEEFSVPKRRKEYALTPSHLKFHLSRLCYRTGKTMGWAEAGHFFRQGLRIARRWRTWVWWKRWLVPAWVVLVLSLRGKARDGLIEKTLRRTGH
jgi:glycosyltransferase involved in cell wall biosynthesis